MPNSWTLDQVGPLCKAVEDTAIMLGTIAGYDELDPASVDVPVPNYGLAFQAQVSKLRLGFPRVPFFEGLDPEVDKAPVHPRTLRRVVNSMYCAGRSATCLPMSAS